MLIHDMWNASDPWGILCFFSEFSRQREVETSAPRSKARFSRTVNYIIIRCCFVTKNMGMKNYNEKKGTIFLTWREVKQRRGNKG